MGCGWRRSGRERRTSELRFLLFDPGPFSQCQERVWPSGPPFLPLQSQHLAVERSFSVGPLVASGPDRQWPLPRVLGHWQDRLLRDPEAWEGLGCNGPGSSNGQRQCGACRPVLAGLRLSGGGLGSCLVPKLGCELRQAGPLFASECSSVLSLPAALRLEGQALRGRAWPHSSFPLYQPHKWWLSIHLWKAYWVPATGYPPEIQDAGSVGRRPVQADTGGQPERADRGPLWHHQSLETGP